MLLGRGYWLFSTPLFSIILRLKENSGQDPFKKKTSQLIFSNIYNQIKFFILNILKMVLAPIS